MKKIAIFSLRVVCCICILSLLFFVGCSGQTETMDKSMVSVCLEQGRGFVARGYVQSVSQESDAVFRLWLQDNFEIVDCSYPDYSVSTEGNFTVLTLHNVRYAARVTLTCEIPTCVVLYDPNGGSFVSTGSTDARSVTYLPSVHPRFNTLSGEEKLSRPGYVLTGWNTESDGSGEHIGLGSRVTTEKRSSLTLYAQWEPVTDALLLSWQETDSGIRLTAYLGGDTDRLVIPEELDGRPVTSIGAGFAAGVAIGSLVIPDTVMTVEGRAFTDCAIESITFCDNLKQVSDDSFRDSRPRYWHINAVLAPRYQAISDITAFADKMDLLMLHQNEKKLLFFSGCSMNYGLDSTLLAQSFPEYTVLNLGAVGGTNAQFQWEIILQSVGSGDVIIHAPEQASSYQLMADTNCENRIFICVEGNYDLLAAVDMTTLGDGAFDCFCAYNYKRSLMEPCTYEDQYIPLNGYGDNAQERMANNKSPFNEDYTLMTELLTDSSLDLLVGYYDRVRAAGGAVYLSYAPINALCCTEEGIAAFSGTWEQEMRSRGYETVSSLRDYVMEAKYFYDSDYHLTTAGAILRTERLIADLLPWLS